MPFRVPARHRGCLDRDQFHDDEAGHDEHGWVRWADASHPDLGGDGEEGDGERERQKQTDRLDGVPEDLVVSFCVQRLRDGLCEPEDVENIEGDDQGNSCLLKRKAGR